MFDAKRFFQVCVSGILAQNKKCKKNEYGICCYRNNKGERCVVGMAIPQEKYVPEMDNEDAIKASGEDAEGSEPGIYAYQNPFVLSVLKEEFGSPLSQSDLDLMQEMQETHDEQDVESWPKSLRMIEEKFFGEESDLCGLKEKTNA